MKIAVTSENNCVFQHFGHTPEFTIYTVENQRVTNKEIVPTSGNGHGALAPFLKNRGVEILLCGGIGSGAQTALTENGIPFVGGTEGNTDAVLNAYVSGTLQTRADFTCSHHHTDAEHGHTCGGNCKH